MYNNQPQSSVQDVSSKAPVAGENLIGAPIVIPVYPAGMPEGGVKRQRGRPKKVRPEDEMVGQSSEGNLVAQDNQPSDPKADSEKPASGKLFCL